MKLSTRNLAQERLHGFELFHSVKLGDMCHLLPIRPGLYEQPVLNLPRKVNRESKSVRHHDQVRKDAIAPKQYISFARHELYWSKRFHEGLQRIIEVDKLRWPIP